MRWDEPNQKQIRHSFDLSSGNTFIKADKLKWKTKNKKTFVFCDKLPATRLRQTDPLGQEYEIGYDINDSPFQTRHCRTSSNT